MFHTKDGAHVAFHCVTYGNSKDRKQIIKSLRGFVAQACKQQFAHLIILRIMDVTDDTELVNKVIILEMLQDVEKLLADRYGRLCFLHILSPKNPKYFSTSTINLLQPTTSLTHQLMGNKEGNQNDTVKSSEIFSEKRILNSHSKNTKEEIVPTRSLPKFDSQNCYRSSGTIGTTLHYSHENSRGNTTRS